MFCHTTSEPAVMVTTDDVTPEDVMEIVVVLFNAIRPGVINPGASVSTRPRGLLSYPVKVRTCGSSRPAIAGVTVARNASDNNART